jgi:hypothetical protein
MNQAQENLSTFTISKCYNFELVHQEGKISYMQLRKETQQACKILLGSEMVMKILPINCVDLTRNDPYCFRSQIIHINASFGATTVLQEV